MSKKISIIFVISAGVLWGCTSIFIKGLAVCGLTSIETAFIRVLSCSILLAAGFVIFRRDLFRIKLKDIWIFIGTGVVSLTLFSACYFKTILNTDAGIAAALLYTSPAFIMIFSSILFKEKITWRKTISITLTIAGCFLISGAAGSGISISIGSLVIGIGAGFFYALYSIFGKFAGKYNPLTVTFYTFLFASFGFLAVVDPVEAISAVFDNPYSLYYVMGIAIICGLLPYCFYTMGLKNLDASTAGVTVAVEPLVAALIGILFYGESTIPAKLIGICLILISILIVK